MSINIKKSKRGTLHDALGISRDKKIPASKLTIKASDSPALKKKKQFAINAKKFKHADDGITLNRAKGITNDDGTPVLMNTNDKVDSSLYDHVDSIETPSWNPKEKQNWGKNILLGLTALDRILPNQPIKRQYVRPQETVNQNMYGTGSEAIYTDGGIINKKSYNPNLAAKDKVFQEWYSKNTMEGKGGMPYTDKGDYDYYSYFRNGDYKTYQGGHFPDTYKRPNHQTFSNESIYSTPENPGGSWDGDKYIPRMDDGGIVNGDPKSTARKVAQVPDGYSPYPELGSNYYHKPTQSSSATVPSKGPKMSNAAWKKYVATKQQSDDVVYIEPNVQAPPAQINPAYMSRGENIFDSNHHAKGLMYYDMPSSVNGTPQTGAANFAYYKPNTSEIDPSKTYTVPADAWNKIAVTNHFSDETALEQYRNNTTLNQYVDGGTIQPLSNNPYSNGPIQEIQGPKHSEGGVDMLINGQPIEAEGGETIHTDNMGNVVIGGNMQAPGTKKKFKSVFKDIAEQEEKANKYDIKSDTIIENKDPKDSFDMLTFNSSKLLKTAADQRLKTLSDQKEHLSTLQQAMLDTAIAHNIDPQEMSKGNIKKLKASDKAEYGMTIKKYYSGGNIPKAGDGLTIPERVAYLKELAAKYGVDPKIMRNLVNQESGFNVDANSGAGAHGIMQFTTPTAHQYGVDNILNSKKPEDIRRVMEAGVKHFKSLLDSNNNDYKLALAAYNGGQGAVDFAKKQLGKSSISGDDLMNYYEQRRKDHPTSKTNAWQNQTYDYINAINSGENIKGFRQKYNYRVPNDSFVNFPVTSPIDTTPYKTSFTTNNLPSPTNITPITNQEGESTGYNAPQTSPFIIPSKRKLPTNQEPLDFNQIVPELYAAATNRVEPVQAQSYNPQLLQPYQVSFQDRLNENNASFNAVKQLADYNPEALGTLAGQKYAADDAVLADEFRTNDAQNRGIYNQNINTLNDAQLKNLQIGDQQYVRQETAKSKTKSLDESILSSIASKYQQNKLENRQLMAAESMSGYRFDADGNLTWYGGDAPLNTSQMVEGNPPSTTKDGKIILNSSEYEYDKYGNLMNRKNKQQEQQLRNRKNGGSIPALYNQLYGKNR